MYISKSMQIGNIFKNSSSSSHASKGWYLKIRISKKKTGIKCVLLIHCIQTKKRNLYVNCVKLVD